MKKLTQKIVSLFLVLTLMLSPCSVFAFAENVSGEQYLTSENILLSMEGKEASSLIKEQIEETGAVVNDDTKIELVVPSDITSRSANANSIESALIVTNVSGTTVTKDVIIPGYDDGLGFKNTGTAMTRAGHTIDYDWYANFTVRGTAVFNYLPSGSMLSCYQPVGAYFTYQKNNANADVRRIEMRYNCEGAVYTYPGYDSLGYSIDYCIPVSKALPAENTMYSNSNPYDTDKVIFTGAAGGGSRQYLTFDVYDSGTYYRQTFPFIYR